MTPRSLTPLSAGIVTGTVSPQPGGSGSPGSGFGGRATRFGEPLYPAVATPVRPETGTPHRHLGSRGPGSIRQTTHFPSADAAAPIGAHPCRSTRPGGAS